MSKNDVIRIVLVGDSFHNPRVKKSFLMVWTVGWSLNPVNGKSRIWHYKITELSELLKLFFSAESFPKK